MTDENKNVFWNFLGFLSMMFIFIVGGLALIVYAAHKDEPRLRAECEARGGMLIGTRNELYTCVGKPPELPVGK